MEFTEILVEMHFFNNKYSLGGITEEDIGELPKVQFINTSLLEQISALDAMEDVIGWGLGPPFECNLWTVDLNM